jgi:hypothetical protein
MPTSTPIFVVGKHRSGTTWLANQLCEHPLIAGVRHEHHHGIHESAFFSRVYGRYGHLSYKPNFIEFIEATFMSDIFQLLGADKDELYALWPTSYEEVFRVLMDHYAARQHARYWLDKTPEHTLLIDQIANIYPDAKFIAIIRDAEAVMASTVGRYDEDKLRHKKRLLVATTMSWLHSNKTIRSFAERSDRIFVTRYETLKARPEETYREICTFLGIAFDPAMLRQSYNPNTTFRAGVERSSVLSEQERRLVQLTGRLGNLLPKRAMDFFKRLYAIRSGPKPLPTWFYSMYPAFAELDENEGVASSRTSP